MKISDHIKPDTTAEFQFYSEGALWYKLSSTGLEFPVPANETGNAQFRASEKGIYLMKWVRRRLEDQEAEQEMIAKLKQEWEESEKARQEQGDS